MTEILSMLLRLLFHTRRRISNLLRALPLHSISLSLRLSFTLINLRPSPPKPAEPTRLRFLLLTLSRVPRLVGFPLGSRACIAVQRFGGIAGFGETIAGGIACRLEFCFEVLADAASPDIFLCGALCRGPFIFAFCL